MSVTAAIHQPIFLPWPGLFRKAADADVLVLLDLVQFPRGRTWLTRNRLKNEDGEVWLTVPVSRKGLLSMLDMLMNCGPKSAQIIA